MSFNPKTAKGELAKTLRKKNPLPEPNEDSTALSTDVADVEPDIDVEIVDDDDNIGNFYMLK